VCVLRPLLASHCVRMYVGSRALRRLRRALVSHSSDDPLFRRNTDRQSATHSSEHKVRHTHRRTHTEHMNITGERDQEYMRESREKQ